MNIFVGSRADEADVEGQSTERYVHAERKTSWEYHRDWAEWATRSQPGPQIWQYLLLIIQQKTLEWCGVTDLESAFVFVFLCLWLNTCNVLWLKKICLLFSVL